MQTGWNRRVAGKKALRTIRPGGLCGLFHEIARLRKLAPSAGGNTKNKKAADKHGEDFRLRH
ncbi:MAG: hypothetical protein L0H75_04140, partial [Nitrosospira sp.]|nr:hypothetical protein [Nitrosospira sp.]